MLFTALARLGAAALALACTAGTLGVLGAPAYAGTEVHRDAVKDVVTIDEKMRIDRARKNRTTDITEVTVRHTARAVALRVEVRNLPRRMGRVGWSAIWSLGVEGRAKPYTIFVGKFEPNRWHGLILPPDGKPKACGFEFMGGAVVTVSRRHDYVQATIPRKCLDEPRWVRAGVAVTDTTKLVMDEEGEIVDATSHFDVAHRRGTTRRSLSSKGSPIGLNIPMGPKVRRG